MALPENVPTFVSAEQAKNDTHPQRLGDKTAFLLGKKRRKRREDADVAAAIKSIDAHLGKS